MFKGICQALTACFCSAGVKACMCSIQLKEHTVFDSCEQDRDPFTWDIRKPSRSSKTTLIRRIQTLIL